MGKIIQKWFKLGFIKGFDEATTTIWGMSVSPFYSKKDITKYIEALMNKSCHFDNPDKDVSTFDDRDLKDLLKIYFDMWKEFEGFARSIKQEFLRRWGTEEEFKALFNDGSESNGE